MTEDQWMNLVWAIGAIALVSSALSIRQLSFGVVVRNVVFWVAIFGLIYVAVLNRDTIRGFFWGLEERLTYGEQTVDGDTVRIRLAPDGHFWVNGEINGVAKRLLVDSGATVTALSSETAAEAGVEVPDNGYPVMLRTANGVVPAKRGNIDRLSIGGLDAENLPVVVSPGFDGIDVLGMNFLSRLKSWRVEGRTLILEPPEEQAGETTQSKAET